MGWLIAIAVVALLAVLPLGVSIAYDDGGPMAKVTVGPFKLQVYPSKRDPNKPPRAKEEKKKQTKKSAPKGSGGKRGGPISDFYPFVRLVYDLLTDFRRKLRVDILTLKLVLAGGDPADLALNYGRAWTALGNLWPRLESLFVIRKRDVEVLCDFTGTQTTVAARLDLSITLGRLLSMGVRHGIRGVKEFINFRNKRKGGTSV